MKDIQNGLGVTNLSDLTLKELYGIYEIKNVTKEQVKEYKMTDREYYERFDNLSKIELNKKNNKETYVRNDVMTTLVKCCRGEKRGIRAIDEFRKKIMIPDSEIPKCPEL